MLVAAAALLLASSAFVFVSAPTGWLWILAILVSEWGQFAALLGVVTFALCVWQGGRLGFAAAAFSFAATMIYVVPAARAAMIAKSLPARFTVAFPQMRADGRSLAPFSWRDLFIGVHVPAVDVTEHVYATDDTKQLKFDLYQRKQAPSSQPLVIMVHGGSWNGGDKEQLAGIDRYLASQGYSVASINYRHAPKWRFPAAVDDVFRALEYMKLNAAELNVDPTRVVLVGRSAGGQVALSAAYAGRDPAIRGVVALYAPTDLVFGYENPSRRGVLDSRKVLEDYLGGAPATSLTAYHAASPVEFVGPSTPPTLLIHGLLDPIVSPVHSELLATRLAGAERPNLYLPLPWATHGCDANLSGPSGQLTVYLTSRFLGGVFAQP